MNTTIRKTFGALLLSAILLGVNALVPSAADAAEAEECRMDLTCDCDFETGECRCYVRFSCPVEA